MNNKFFISALAAVATIACSSPEMKPQKDYIGPSTIQIADGHMSPEVLLSLGRLSDPQLSPDGKTILYGYFSQPQCSESLYHSGQRRHSDSSYQGREEYLQCQMGPGWKGNLFP